MRDLASQQTVLDFMERFGRGIREPVRVYLTGGSTAVLMGWRETTIDIDIRFFPELDELYRRIPKIKEDLHLNVELAAPSDFVPVAPGWEHRSILIKTIGNVSFFHYDLYGQALAKIERGHDQDISDVNNMIKDGLVEPQKLTETFQQIKPMLYKYPALDPTKFAAAVEKIAGSDG